MAFTAVWESDGDGSSASTAASSQGDTESSSSSTNHTRLLLRRDDLQAPPVKVLHHCYGAIILFYFGDPNG